MQLATLFAKEQPLDRLLPALHVEILYSQWAMADIKAAPQQLATTCPLLIGFRASPGQQVAASFIPQGWFDMNEATILQTYGRLWSRLQNTTDPARFAITH
jgi:hypothetical protein